VRQAWLGSPGARVLFGAGLGQFLLDARADRRAGADPQQAVSFGPHPEPELEALRKDTFRALEIADEHAEIRAMSRVNSRPRSSKATARKRRHRRT
jgi:hypothetical protein